MLTDKQTLKDLEIFISEENSTSLFSFTDKTKTAGGSSCLRQKFLNPPGTFDELKKQQEAVYSFSEKAGFSYPENYISHAVSDMRLGMTIIENEKIMDLLNSYEKC